MTEQQPPHVLARVNRKLEPLGKPKPTKAPKHRHQYFRRVCQICGHKKPVRPKSERQLLEAELWDLTAQIVKLRDRVCVTCGTTEKPTMSHWIKCGKQAVRYDLRNCNQQCAPCNDRHNNWTYFYDNYMLRHYGQEIMTQLTQRAIESDSKNFKWSVVELREMVEERKRMLDDRQAEAGVVSEALPGLTSGAAGEEESVSAGMEAEEA